MATNLNPLVFCFLLLINSVATQPNNQPPSPPPPHVNNSFKPGIAIIVGLSTTIFSATFLLLLYMKHCKRAPPTHTTTTTGYSASQQAAWRTNSGLNRKVIGSLPTFRFSSLRGQKEGLECAVCLNRFEPDEVLRLLPKCKHAFHVECVDTWLDAHSTCPLCRYRVDPEDVLLLNDFGITLTGTTEQNSTSTCNNSENSGKQNPRVSGRHSEKSVVEMIVEKNRGVSDFDRKRTSLDSWINYSRRKLHRNSNGDRKLGELENKLGENHRKDGELLPVKELHKLEHRIIIGEGEDRRRWSDAQTAECLYLESENLIGIGMRSVSEMTRVSRYSTSGGCGGSNNKSNNGGRRKEEEKVVKRWLAWISQQQPIGGSGPAIVQQQPNITALSSSSATSIVVV